MSTPEDDRSANKEHEPFVYFDPPASRSRFVERVRNKPELDTNSRPTSSISNMAQAVKNLHLEDYVDEDVNLDEDGDVDEDEDVDDA